MACRVGSPSHLMTKFDLAWRSLQGTEREGRDACERHRARLALADYCRPRHDGRNTKMAESTQHKLDRVRAPRVQITYDLEKGDAKEKKELPYVIGVVGDFSGQPEKELARLKDRKFVGVDRDNFNDVLKAMTPRLETRVENTLKGDGSQLGVELKFNSLKDFEPENVVKQIEPLRKLLELRQKLSDLR